MKKFLLKLAPGEPLSLVQELPYFDNSIKLDPLLESALDLCVHDISIGLLFHAVRVNIYWCQLFYYLQGVQEWWKIRSKEVHIKHWVQAKEWGKVELKIIVTRILGNGVGSTTWRKNIPMRPSKVIFLQVKPNFVSHLKHVWYPMVIMALLVLGIRLL
jgi:hypothetical protein